MNLFLEERAATARIALGIRDVPQRTDVPRLLELLGDALRFAPAAVPRARLVTLSDGRGLVLLPSGLLSGDLDEARLHEAAHFLLQHGAAWWFRTHGDTHDRVTRRRAEWWEAREEREVEDFLLAFLVPAELVRLVKRDAELSRLCGVSRDLIQRRRHQLRGRWFSLDRPPDWAAWWRLRVVYHPSPHCRRYRVAPRDGEGLPLEIPVRAEEVAEMCFRLSGDLVALTEPEFRAKWGAFQAEGQAEDVTLDLRGLYAALR